ncbi:restriction endonuclease [Opitutales bacterium]|nr:restriction endonuclease [Opitutales bacterium]MDB2681048.1 restriction endonuclease [Opitutales bacterium]
MKNTGIPYELLTKRIFQDILDQSDVKTIKVEHNVILQGKTANHQIDVYWKFELNGIEYETVVQAKDWNQTVNQGELLKFKAVLDDLPGSPVGIFVTRTGYQSGASDYAKSQGIKLYELREPTDNDFEGRIKEIHVRMNFRIPQVSQEQPVLDVEWAKAEKKRHNLSDEDLTVQLGGMANEIYFKDSKGNPKLSFHDASNQLVDQATADESLLTLTFDEPLFIETKNSNLPLVRCLGFQAKVAIVESKQEMVLKAEDTVAFILKNVVTGDIETFKK